MMRLLLLASLLATGCAPARQVPVAPPSYYGRAPVFVGGRRERAQHRQRADERADDTLNVLEDLRRRVEGLEDGNRRVLQSQRPNDRYYEGQ